MKLFKYFSALLIIVLAGSVANAEDARRPMSIDDGLRLVGIGDVTLSPDGNLVLYGTRELDWSENDYQTKHFLYRVDDKQTIQFIGDQGGEDFRFSPDGDQLAFLRSEASDEDDDGDMQIFVMPVAGGEALQLTEHRGGVSSFQWLPDAKGMIFIADDQQSEELEKERELGHDAYFVDEAPNGKHAARYSNFWHVDLDTQETKQLSDLSLIIGGFDVSPDGQQIVFDARPDDRTNYPGDAELYLLPIGEDSPRRLTNNNAPEDSAIWAPNGKLIAYRAPDAEEYELRVGSFWTLNPATGETRQLEGQNTGELITAPAWTADSRYVVYSEVHGTNTNLYRINVSTGKAEAMTKMTGTLSGYAFSSNTRRMVYGYQNFTTPEDLYVSDLRGRNATRITNLNPWVAESLALSEPELLQWTSKGGLTIEGAYYPAVGAGNDPVPMIVNIHGGPAGVIVNTFREDFQILAGEGFALLGPNFRGSTGYGDEHLRGLMGEVGDGESIDVFTGVDYAIAERNVDPDRLGVRGWSWGGVSTSYVVTQTDRFKAASIGAMVGNWAAETGPGFNFDVSLWYIGGTPWDNPAEWAKRSSITHVKNVTTPSIIFHGGEDETSSVGQSLMFYTALRDIGKAPVRYMNFPREGHGVREPRHRRQLQVEELRWFHRYINGRDWNAEAPSFDAGDE